MASSIAHNRRFNGPRQMRSFTSARCLVAHIAGDEAGLLLVRVHLRESATDELIRGNVKLLIAGEVEPLEPVAVEGHDLEFTIAFFSAAVANSGQLPSEAELQLDSADGYTEFVPVQILSTIEVTHRMVNPDESIDPPEPRIVYPKNGVVYSVIAIFIGMIVGFIVLAGMN